MTTVMLVLILVILILLLCAVSFVSGYIIANKPKQEPAQNKELTEQEKERLERQNREALRRQKEMQNFWNYNGDEQDKLSFD